MLIERLEVQGLFSFGPNSQRFELDFDDRLTVIVGPNASGKSNIGRALGLVQAVLRYQEAGLPDRDALYLTLDDHAWSSRHRGMAADDRSLVRIKIQLTSQAEVEQLVSFVQTAILSSLLGNMGNSGGDITPLEDWVATGISAATLASLQQGTIMVSHSGIPGTTWEAGYEFAQDGNTFTWHLASGRPNLVNTITLNTPQANDFFPTVVTVSQRLTGNHPGSGPQPPAPPPDAFSLSSLLPIDSNIVLISSEMLNWQPVPAIMRAFLASAGIVAPALNPQEPMTRRYTLSGVLSRILYQTLALTRPGEDQVDLSIPGSGGRTYPAAALTRPLAGHGLSNLPGRLFQLMNGDNGAQERYRAVQQLFTQFAPGHRLELTSGHTAVPGDSEVFVNVQINVLQDNGPTTAPELTPLQSAGTGVEQALVLAETIANSAGQVLVLDEPAVNLHPPWQRLILSRLRSGPGQFVLMTHSPYLVPAESDTELASVVRLGLRQRSTRANRLQPADLQNRLRMGGWIRELAGSADARGLLFAAGVVLVEGETELGALPAWFAKSPNAKQHRAPDDLHLGFYSVGGDTGFALLVSYLARFDLPWAIVCDGAAFRTDRRDNVLVQVLDAGVEDTDLEEFVGREKLRELSQSALDELRFRFLVNKGACHGVFTLASGWHRAKDKEGDSESFEAYLHSDPALSAAHDQARTEIGDRKPQLGRRVAGLTECPSVVDDLYGRLLERLWSRGMLRLPDL